jgi:hypothetical protein
MTAIPESVEAQAVAVMPAELGGPDLPRSTAVTVADEPTGLVGAEVTT